MAITKIQSGAFPADVITSSAIDDLSVTHAKLHTTMDLSSKTVTLPTLNTPLTVFGNGNATLQWGDDTAIAALSFDTNDNPLIRSYSGKDLFFQTNGANNRIVIKSGGNVGIGTDNPSSKLHMESGNSHNKLSITTTALGGTGYDASIDLLSSANNSEVAINMGSNSDPDREQIKTYQSDMIFRTNNSPRVTILSDGNVGIGQPSPTARLHVKSAGTGNVLYVESSDGHHLGGFYQESDTRAAFNVRDASGNVKVNLDAGGDSWFTGGNVGIGTTGPVSSGYDTASTKLTVMSTTLNNATSGYLELASRANSNGYNAGAIQFNNFENAGTGGSGVQNRTVGQIRTVIATTDSNAGDDSGGTMEFYTKSEAGNLTQNMTIHSNGNVGIGTTTPSEKLHIEGNVRLTDAGSIQFGSSKYQTLTGQAGSNDLLYRTYSSHIFKTATGPSNNTDGTERIRIDNAGLKVGTGTGGGNPPSNTSILFGSSDNRNIQFLGQSASGVEGTIGAWNGVYNFQSSKIVFNKPAGNVGDIEFYTNQGAGPVKRMTIQHNGVVAIVGSLSKGSGSFKINHPLPSKAETHDLVHSFVESPQANNIYRGKVILVDGLATVNIDTVSGMTDGTYVLLNTNTQCFTSNETGWTAVKGSVLGNTLTITSQVSCTDTISWMVIGERHDQHMIDTDWTDDNGKVIVEPLKENESE